MSNDPVSVQMTATIARALTGTPFLAPRMWTHAVVVVRADEPAPAKLRGDFAGWLTASALPTLARECIRRQVPPGSVLVYLEIDTEEAAGARFLVYPLARALQEVTP